MKGKLFGALILIAIGFIGAYLIPYSPKKTIVLYEKQPPKGFVLVKTQDMEKIKDSLFLLSDSLNKILTKYEHSISLVSQVKVTTDSLKAEGKADSTSNDTIVTYEDSIIKIKYFTQRKWFNYTLKPSDFYLTFVFLKDSLVRVRVEHLHQTHYDSISIYRPKNYYGSSNSYKELFGIKYTVSLGLFVNPLQKTFGIGSYVDFPDEDYSVNVALSSDKTWQVGVYKRIF